MQTDEIFRQYFISLVTQLPAIIIYCVGLVLAIVWRPKHPKAALLTMFGSLILLFNLLVMTGVQIWLSRYWATRMNSPLSMNSLLSTIGFLRSLLGAAGFALLLMAVFTGRSVTPETKS